MARELLPLPATKPTQLTAALVAKLEARHTDDLVLAARVFGVALP